MCKVMIISIGRFASTNKLGYASRQLKLLTGAYHSGYEHRQELNTSLDSRIALDGLEVKG
jgi:hypothetical protein